MARPIVFITGGLSGIGAATAVEFARLGAGMLLVDRSLEREAEIVARVAAAGGEAVAAEADVRDYGRVEDVAALALDRFGRIDVLVANAGIADHGPTHSGDPDR